MQYIEIDKISLSNPTSLVAVTSLSSPILWAGTGSVPDWTEWQIGTGIQELDPGTEFRNA